MVGDITRGGEIGVDQVANPTGVASQLSVDHPLSIAAGIMVLVLGSLNYPLMPMVVGAITDHLPISASQAGFVATADMLGMFLASALALSWVRRFNWRQAALWLSLMLVAAHVLSGFCSTLPLLLLARMLAGFCGGSMMALGNTALGDSRTPERNTALFNIVQQGTCAVAFLLMPLAITGYGAPGAFFFLAALVLPGMLFGQWLPRMGRWPRPTTDQATDAPSRAIVLIIGATLPVFLFFLGFGASWTYIERVGVGAGLSHDMVSKSLSISVLAGMGGSAAAFLLGTRLGRVVPLFVTAISNSSPSPC